MMRCLDFFLMTRCRVTRQKYVPTFIRWWVPPLAPLSYSTHQPIPHPPPLTYNYHPWPPPQHPPITSHPLISTLLPTATPNTPQGPHPVQLHISRLPSPVSGLPSPVPSPVFRLLSLISRGRGEVGRQNGWKMTAVWGGVRLASRRVGG